MKAVVLDARDMLHGCKVLGYTTDNLEWCIAKYLADRYILPISYPTGYPTPINIPDERFMARYLEGSIDSLVYEDVDADAVLQVSLNGNYIVIER